jgi:hypothetical protein
MASITEKLASLQGALNGIAGIASTIQPWIGPVVFGIETLWNEFHKSNPNATPEDFISWLRSEGKVVQNVTDTWALAKGYVQDPATGDWKKPTT